MGKSLVSSFFDSQCNFSMKIVVFFKFVASIFGLDNEILVLSQDRSNLFDDWNNLSEVCRFAEQII